MKLDKTFTPQSRVKTPPLFCPAGLKVRGGVFYPDQGNRARPAEGKGGGLPVRLGGVEKGTQSFPPAALKSDRFLKFIRFLGK